MIVQYLNRVGLLIGFDSENENVTSQVLTKGVP